MLSREDFKLLKDILKAGSTFSELAALRIQGRDTVAFIHSGINEKTVWLVLCVQKPTQKTRLIVAFSYLSIVF